MNVLSLDRNCYTWPKLFVAIIAATRKLYVFHAVALCAWIRHLIAILRSTVLYGKYRRSFLECVQLGLCCVLHAA